MSQPILSHFTALVKDKHSFPSERAPRLFNLCLLAGTWTATNCNNLFSEEKLDWNDKGSWLMWQGIRWMKNPKNALSILTASTQVWNSPVLLALPFPPPQPVCTQPSEYSNKTAWVQICTNSAQTGKTFRFCEGTVERIQGAWRTELEKTCPCSSEISATGSHRKLWEILLTQLRPISRKGACTPYFQWRRNLGFTRPSERLSRNCLQIKRKDKQC